MPTRFTTRRDFLAQSAGTTAGLMAPYVFTSAAGAASETIAKTDRIRIGLIGAGGMGRGNMRAARDWFDVVAISDVDAQRAEAANQQLSEGRAELHPDYRDLLARTDLDALHIATPDHWHAKQLVEAMRSGIDVYCEKPLTLTIDEGKLIREVQRETGRVVQVGTQQRSTFGLFNKAIAIVAAGRLGKLRRLRVGINRAASSPSLPAVAPPSHLDWDRWLGPAPAADYRRMTVERDNGKKKTYTNCHYDFRWWYEYSGGKLTDWGAHHVDVAMWALAATGQAEGPVNIWGKAEHDVTFVDGAPVERDRYNTATRFDFFLRFAGDVEVQVSSEGRRGVLIEGDKGRLFVNRGELTGGPVEALVDDPLPEDAIAATYKGAPLVDNERRAHWANFAHCLRERSEPVSDVHSHMEALNICHLLGISARLGRSITWDTKGQEILGDEQANGMLARPYRAGFEIEG